MAATAIAPAAKKAKKEDAVAVEEEEWKGFSDDLQDCDDSKGHDRAASDSENDDYAEYDALLASDDSDLDDSIDSSAAQLQRELAQAVASIGAGDDSSDTATSDQGLSTEIPSDALSHSSLQLSGLAINSKPVVDKKTGLLIDRTKPTNGDSDSSDQPPSPKLKTTASAFLPSLTMGGYWSGSEGDEPEDIEEHVAPRKNRRGQRARQAISEAKFGAAAKHVVEGRPANKPKDARDAGWDMKRGATNAEDVRGLKGMDRKERRSRMKGAHEAGASGGNAIPIASGKPAVVKPKRDDIGSLHPSWEAKRKAKAATGKIVPFQGKKITFD